MAQANVEVPRLIDAFNEGGVSEPSVGFFDADAVFEEPLDQPGSEEAHGQDAVGRTSSRFDEGMGGASIGTMERRPGFTR